MSKQAFVSFSLSLFVFTLQSQTIEEFKSQKLEKEAQIAALRADISDINAKIEELNGPKGWEFGSLGTVGLNFSRFNNWISTSNPNTFASTIGFSGSAFASLEQEKYFWKNSTSVNIAKTKLDIDTDDNVSTKYETSADAFGISTLYGRKIINKIAISGLGEYRTTILSNFNKPGYLDVGVGGTWTPINNMIVVFHPLNYNFVFSENELIYTSSLGTKVVADYSRALPKGIAWKTNLSTFLSYKNFTNFSNWIWVNGFSLKLWKSLGVGFELGLKGNKQESYNFKLDQDNLSPDDFKIEDLKSSDNPIQTYWLLGFTYKL